MDNQTLLHEIRQWSQGIRYLSPIPVIEAVRLLFEQLESVQRERDLFQNQFYWAEKQMESLQRDKAALIEVLEWFTDEDKWDDNGLEVIFKDGRVPIVSARTILTQMKGETL